MWHLPLEERIKYDEWLSKTNDKISNLSDWSHFLAQPFKPEIITEYFEGYPTTNPYSLDEFITSSQQAGIELVFKEQDELEKTIDEHGTITYKLNGLLHRTDGPAIEYADGTKCWYIKGELYREDGPVVEWSESYIQQHNKESIKCIEDIKNKIKET
jgi:hypothetical protein